jgi:hypothetical protein
MWLNLLGQVVGQLYEQKTVAQIPRLLGMDKRTVNMTRNLVAQYGDEYQAKYGKSLYDAIKAGDVASDYAKLFNYAYL